MKIALASDHAGKALKDSIAIYLKEKGHLLHDFGAHSEESVDYPDFAISVASAVQSGKCRFGILVCGTGIGMSIAANKHTGIRAALCAESYSARCAREHNDANVLTLGSRVTGPGLALEIAEVFLQAEFAGGRHEARVSKIAGIEVEH